MIIRAHDIIKISEEWYQAKSVRSNYIDVFINPSATEIRKVASKDSKRIRFTADARIPQKVFVWDAMKAIHYEMLSVVGSDRIDSYPYIIGGVAEVQGSSVVMVGWDHSFHVMNLLQSSSRGNVIEFLTKLFSYDWTWLNKYFKATDYINKRKSEFQKLFHLKD